MTDALTPFRAAGLLEPLDVHFARALARLAGDDSPELLLGAAFASRAPRHGHICAELTQLRHTVRVEVRPQSSPDGAPNAEPLNWPKALSWQSILRQSPAVAVAPGWDDHGAIEGVDQGDALRAACPLILVGDQLYLSRYYDLQRRLVVQIRGRARSIFTPKDIDEAALGQGLARLFPRPKSLAPGSIDRQRLAALIATLRRFTVISGGPGTGKTSTVRRILALLIEQGEIRHRHKGVRFPPRILLLAPTGKAAARLRQSLLSEGPEGDLGPLINQAMPTEASTIHRALGVLPGRPTHFRHDADHPLLADIVIVDEASMVDLSLMSRLIEAVPADARLIILGDRDQLASVEAGAVLGDICADEAIGAQRVSSKLATRIAAIDAEASLPEDAVQVNDVGVLGDAMVHLTHTFRFDAGGGIGALATAIKNGKVADAEACLASASGDGALQWLQLTGDDPKSVRTLIEGSLRALTLKAMRPWVRDATRTPAELSEAELATRRTELLRAMESFRILCAHRRGPLGVEGINLSVQRWLAADGLIRPDRVHYAGRPILITRNDYQLGLFNGDIGVLVNDGRGGVQAIFEGRGDEPPRAFHPARLPPHETVFAMTVHKSQGSQFEHAVVVLPARPSRILTRELIYTAVTRAQKRITLVGRRETLAAAIQDRVQRASGLRAALWGGK